MKRQAIAFGKYNPNFIGSWMIEQDELCNQMINYFDENFLKQKAGETTKGLNKEAKDRTDITILPKLFANDSSSIFHNYFDSLAACLKDYGEQWPFIRQSIEFFDIRSFNLAKYEKGQHFGVIHCERTFSTLDRELAFTTYLSENIDGGSTYFSHYDIEITPKKGQTLIWPAMWTHAHKGNIVKDGSKYIVTGWFNLVSKKSS